jgi:hypothetical protein
MAAQSKDYQAMEYVYNLENYAKENGFKPDESWELGLATDAEKSAIERGYYPTLSKKMLPGELMTLFTLIKEQMHKLKINFGNMPLPETILPNTLEYIIAFNPARRRR